MAQQLILSPLTSREIYDRETDAARYVAHCVLQGRHEPDADSYWRDAFNNEVAELRALAAAAEQRLYDRPNGLADLVAERRARREAVAR